MRTIRFILVIALFCSLFAAPAVAATFKLGDGQTVTGEILENGSNDSEALIRTGSGPTDYKRVNWGLFSQETLGALKVQFKDNKKIVEAIDPYIEISQEERAAKTEVHIKPLDPIVAELQAGRQEPKSSVIGSLFQSGLGWLLVVLVYAANVYAGIEIAIFRVRPTAVVAGLAAIPGLGFLSNIIFLAMPTAVESTAAQERAEAEAARHEPTPTIAIPGQAEAEAHQAATAAQAVAEGPKAEVYARGKFTFNKRFFETKFASFFGMSRSAADKAKVLIVKTGKHEYQVNRITRISPSDLYIEAAGSVGEITIHFSEILEVTLRPH